jgi:hypothetical protein
MPLEEFARELLPIPYHQLAVTPVMQSKRLHIQVNESAAQSPVTVKAGSASLSCMGRKAQ